MNNKFYVADIPDEDYEANKDMARLKLLMFKYEPMYSTGICGSITAGYGRCDEYGYFEFPLKVNQDTYEVTPYETESSI